MQTGPEELRMTRQMKVSTEPQEEGRPGQHQGQLSVAPRDPRPSEISHSLICSLIPQISIECHTMRALLWALEDTSENSADKTLCPHQDYFLVGEDITNKTVLHCIRR